MFKQVVKDYLSFSKNERIAVLLLLLIIIALRLLPTVWPSHQPKAVTVEKKKAMVAQLARLTENENDRGVAAFHKKEKDYQPRTNEIWAASPNNLFYFDPNQLTLADGEKLGLRASTVQIIIHYLAKGGRFKQPADLLKIYGMHANEYERLLPYIKIERVATPTQSTTNRLPRFGEKKKEVPLVVDINTADTTLLIALPGIGSKLANRIVKFREKLGGFYAVDQVAEIYGLADSSFLKLKPMLRCSSSSIHWLFINTASVEVLKTHPYCGYKLANAIVLYRQQHGPYQSVDDLQNIVLLTTEMFQKLKPYISVN
jgi:competence protein ComEA